MIRMLRSLDGRVAHCLNLGCQLTQLACWIWRVAASFANICCPRQPDVHACVVSPLIPVGGVDGPNPCAVHLSIALPQERGDPHRSMEDRNTAFRFDFGGTPASASVRQDGNKKDTDTALVPAEEVLIPQVRLQSTQVAAEPPILC